MDTALTVEPTAEEEAELKKAIEEMFAQMEQADARIRAYHADTDRLKAETQAMLAQLEADLPTDSQIREYLGGPPQDSRRRDSRG